MNEVVITKAEYLGRDEIFTEWFRCKNCDYDSLSRADNYCAECGSELRWMISDEELYELQSK